jgi:hypothetical protein
MTSESEAAPKRLSAFRRLRTGGGSLGRGRNTSLLFRINVLYLLPVGGFVKIVAAARSTRATCSQFESAGEATQVELER